MYLHQQLIFPSQQSTVALQIWWIGHPSSVRVFGHASLVLANVHHVHHLLIAGYYGMVVTLPYSTLCSDKTRFCLRSASASLPPAATETTTTPYKPFLRILATQKSILRINTESQRAIQFLQDFFIENSCLNLIFLPACQIFNFVKNSSR